MDINQAAELLGMSTESVEEAISQGLCQRAGSPLVKLSASKIGEDWELTEQQLEVFVTVLEAQEPGRHPPIAVRRQLLLEAGYRCSVCDDSGHLEFHHIIEFSEIKHHDPNHMLAVCPTCHTKMTRGTISRPDQRRIKDGLRVTRLPEADALFPMRLNWDDLRRVIEGVHEGAQHSPSTALAGTSARFDFTSTDIEEKNRINRLGESYFRIMADKHEPYFARIDEFLEDPVNADVRELYLDIVDSFRNRIAVAQRNHQSFEELLVALREQAQVAMGSAVKGRLQLLSALLSYMYLSCDIGRTT